MTWNRDFPLVIRAIPLKEQNMSDLNVKQYVFRKGAAKRIPVSGTFELTSRCNFRCKMCYIQMTPEEQKNVGCELTTQEWLDLAQKAVDNGMIYLLLTGGEPLLRPDFTELYTRLVQMGLVVSVNTNGALITPRIAECFRQFPPERVNVTLYGASACRYAGVCGNESGYAQTMQGLRLLKQAGIRITLNTTFIRENLPDMETLVTFAKQENIPIRTAAYLFPPVRNGHTELEEYMSAEEMGRAAAVFDHMTLTAEQKRKRLAYIDGCLSAEPDEDQSMECKPASCMAGRGAFWISWDGVMYPCGMLSDEGTSIRAYDFSEAWSKTVNAAQKLCLPAECSVCRYRKLCPSCAAVSACVNRQQGTLVPDMCIRTQAYIQTFRDLN